MRRLGFIADPARRPGNGVMPPSLSRQRQRTHVIPPHHLGHYGTRALRVVGVLSLPALRHPLRQCRSGMVRYDARELVLGRGIQPTRRRSRSEIDRFGRRVRQAPGMRVCGSSNRRLRRGSGVAEDLLDGRSERRAVSHVEHTPPHGRRRRAVDVQHTSDGGCDGGGLLSQNGSRRGDGRRRKASGRSVVTNV